MTKKRVLVTNLAPFRGIEQVFFKRLLSALEGEGCECILWSGAFDGDKLAKWHVPLHWRINNWPYLLKEGEVNGSDALAFIDQAKWQPRVDVLPKQEFAGKLPRRALLEIIARTSLNILDSFEPDLMLSWNPLCPHTGICADMAKSRGIPTLLIERGIFPESWYLENGGLLGHSVLTGQPLESLIPAHKLTDYAEIGEIYLGQMDFINFNSYPQSAAGFSELQKFGSQFARRIIFFPPDDNTLGFLPVEGADRLRSLPGYKDSFDAARALAAATNDLVVFKRHPSSIELSYDTSDYPNLVVSSVDFRLLINWADVVASSGSGLGFVALAKQKPLISMAHDLLTGKDIAYDASTPDSIAQALEAAFLKSDHAKRRQRYHQFVGYLMGDYFVTLGGIHPRFRSPESAASWAAQAVSFTDTPKRLTLLEARAAICAKAAQYDVPVEASAEACAKNTPESPAADTFRKNAPPGELLDAVRACPPDDVIVVDFDHTLFLGNSTELFIQEARPAAMAIILDSLATRLFKAVCGKAAYQRWRDFVRVATIIFLMPWALITWRSRAKKIVSKRINNCLMDALKAAQSKQIVIASLGFKEVIRPLLEAAGMKYELIASSILSPARHLRRVGKAHAVAAAIGQKAIQTSLVITDSLDDLDLLRSTNNGWLVPCQTPPELHSASPPVYVPLRYTAEGKSPGKDILWNQYFGEDFFVYLLAYSWTLAILPAALPFFLAVITVYEIGYYENDFVAAKKEKSPTLSTTHAQFAGYPIWQAWLWALPLGLCAAALLPGSFTINSLLILLILIGIRAIFWLHNRTAPVLRIWVYPFLQVAKTCALLPFIGVSIAGGTLLVAQIMRQVTNYNIYRAEGDTSKFRRQSHRLIIFVLLSVILLLSGVSLSHFLTLQAVLIMAWIVFRFARESYGSLPVMLVKLHSIFRPAEDKQNSDSKRLIIYGTSVAGARAYWVLSRKHEIVCFLDDDPGKQEKHLLGVPIRPVTDLKEVNYDQIVIANDAYYEALIRLRVNGVAEDMIISDRQAAPSASSFAGKEVYFWGCGATYKKYRHFFADAQVRCILFDLPNAPQSVDGIPVKHPAELYKTSAERLPVIVFTRAMYCSTIEESLYGLYNSLVEGEPVWVVD